VPAKGVLRSKEEENNPAYNTMSAKFTFLGQFQPVLAMRVGELPMLALQVMVHIGACIVHALQKC
jgi:hypothetical protein